MEFIKITQDALRLVWQLDAQLIEIIGLSLYVSLSAVAIASLIGLPLGAILAIKHFPTRNFWVNLLNAFMGLPPVVVGLFVYLILSRSGPLGPLGLLYTPTAMIIAQVFLIFPIIGALSCQSISDLWVRHNEQLRSLGSSSLASARTLVWEGRFSLVTAILAGFGRGNAEVGAVLIVGGNISHETRVMTTTIAMEGSKGNFSLALSLGIILISISISVSLLAYVIKKMAGEAPRL